MEDSRWRYYRADLTSGVEGHTWARLSEALETKACRPWSDEADSTWDDTMSGCCTGGIARSWLRLLRWCNIRGWTNHLILKRVLLFHHLLNREVPIMMVLALQACIPGIQMMIAWRVRRTRRVSMGVASRLMLWVVFWYLFLLTLCDIFMTYLYMHLICVCICMVSILSFI